MRVNYEDPHVQPEIISASGTNADAVATKAADEDQFWMVDWIAYSYKGTLGSGASLSVVIGSTTVLSLDISAAGPNIIHFPRPLYVGTKNEALTITLAAGGAAVDGKVYARIR